VATCGLGVVTSASVFVACAAALSPVVDQVTGQVCGALARLASRPGRCADCHASGHADRRGGAQPIAAECLAFDPAARCADTRRHRSKLKSASTSSQWI
jgi:hypothetical protein